MREALLIIAALVCMMFCCEAWEHAGRRVEQLRLGSRQDRPDTLRAAGFLLFAIAMFCARAA